MSVNKVCAIGSMGVATVTWIAIMVPGMYLCYLIDEYTSVFDWLRRWLPSYVAMTMTVAGSLLVIIHLFHCFYPRCELARRNRSVR